MKSATESGRNGIVAYLLSHFRPGVWIAVPVGESRFLCALRAILRARYPHRIRCFSGGTDAQLTRKRTRCLFGQAGETWPRRGSARRRRARAQAAERGVQAIAAARWMREGLCETSGLTRR